MAKQLVYQVAVGEVPAFYWPCIESVRRYCERHGYAHYVQVEPILRIIPKNSRRSANALRLGYLPIYEKEAAFEKLADYDAIAVIDADVYARDRAPGLFEGVRSDFAGCIERDMPALPHHRDKVVKYSEGQYRALADVDWDWNAGGAAFYNMGVMVLGPGFKKHLDGQTPEQFLRRPEFERFVNGEGHFKWSTDQTLLNWFVKKSGMTTQNLDWRWNALYGAVRDVTEAHFVHFFLSSKMPRGGAEIPDIIERL